MERSFFLSIGNGRSGTTWLETMLGDLPDVATDLELTWSSEGATQRHQVSLSSPYQSVKNILLRISDKPVVGSKLMATMDNTSPPRDANILEAVIEPEIKLIHLCRPYFEVFLSIYARGAVFRIDPGRAATSLIGRNLARLDRLHAEKLHGVRVSMDLATVSQTVFFWTLVDLVCVDLCRRSQAAVTLDYADIDSRFPEICRFVGSRADEDAIRSVAAAPLTKKLPRLNPSLVEDSAKVEEICRFYDGVRRQAIASRRGLASFAGEGDVISVPWLQGVPVLPGCLVS